MRKAIIASALALTLCGCTNKSGATRALLNAGYSDINLTGYRFMMCGQDDISSTGFEAKGPTGRPVTGAVCQGFWKVRRSDWIRELHYRRVDALRRTYKRTRIDSPRNAGSGIVDAFYVK